MEKVKLLILVIFTIFSLSKCEASLTFLSSDNTLVKTHSYDHNEQNSNSNRSKNYKLANTSTSDLRTYDEFVEQLEKENEVYIQKTEINDYELNTRRDVVEKVEKEQESLFEKPLIDSDYNESKHYTEHDHRKDGLNNYSPFYCNGRNKEDCENQTGGYLWKGCYWDYVYATCESK
jgi:hypothetical protein